MLMQAAGREGMLRRFTSSHKSTVARRITPTGWASVQTAGDIKMADQQPELCSNCGRQIGKLETPHLWLDQVVCAECHERIEKSQVQPQTTSKAIPLTQPSSSVVTKTKGLLSRVCIIIGFFLSIFGAVQFLYFLNYLALYYQQKSAEKLVLSIACFWLACPFFAIGYRHKRTFSRILWSVFLGFIIFWALVAFMLEFLAYIGEIDRPGEN